MRCQLTQCFMLINADVAIYACALQYSPTPSCEEKFCNKTLQPPLLQLKYWWHVSRCGTFICSQKTFRCGSQPFVMLQKARTPETTLWLRTIVGWFHILQSLSHLPNRMEIQQSISFSLNMFLVEGCKHRAKQLYYMELYIANHARLLNWSYAD